MTRFFAAVAAVLIIAASAASAESPVAGCLPGGFAGFAMEGGVAAYGPENLYRYIDGEAELYLPYGFDGAAVARYAQAGGKGYAISAAVFRMGSLLDAFGIFAQYRSADSAAVPVGAEGFGDASQLMFYQGRYFVRIEVSGAASGDVSALAACARAISDKIPAGRERPAELGLVDVAGAVPGTTRYYPSAVLGYGFFGRGFTTEAMLGGERVKPVVMLFASEAAAGQAMDKYGSYIKAQGGGEAAAAQGGTVVHAADPLYKGVVLRRSGRFIVGVAGLKDAKLGDGLAASLRDRLPAR